MGSEVGIRKVKLEEVTAHLTNVRQGKWQHLKRLKMSML